MFRYIARRTVSHVQTAVRCSAKRATPVVTAIRHSSAGPAVSEEEFDQQYEAVLNKPNITGYEIRNVMSDLHDMDLVPEPAIINAAMRACRRVNDYALAVRILESIKFKSGGDKAIWGYVVQEVTPTLQELGILTPEQMGYDKPELALENVWEMH